ncbi:MAG: DNA polymerase III subunit beta [Flavobacteriaceae bacterium]|nr:DNA polymerase III subunit beta [Flavobacteriaceae bacterium]
MKFIVSSTEMLKKLQILGGVINNNNAMPILDHFLLDLNENELQVTASDLETNMSAKIPVESNDKGEIAVQAKLLLNILKEFPEQPLTFLVMDNQTIEISSDFGKYALAYSSAEDFPKVVEVEEPSSTVIQADILATAINKTIFATGNDDMRPVMNGIFFEFATDEIKFVGTDAHKLVKYGRTDLSASEDAQFIMPKKPLNLLKNILAGEEDEVLIEYNDTNARFSFENFDLVCRLIDGKYPNYEAVIPKENPNVLVIDRMQFLNSVRRVSIFSNKTTHQIRMKIAGTELKISAEDIDYSNKAEERLVCDYRGDDMEIGFNSKFLLEMLNNLNSDEIQLAMSLPNRAGILTPIDGLDEGEKVTMLVMPVMLGR